MRVNDCINDVTYLHALVNVLFGLIDNPQGIDLDKVEAVRDSYLDWEDYANSIPVYVKNVKHLDKVDRLQKLQTKFAVLENQPFIDPDTLIIEEGCEDV